MSEKIKIWAENMKKHEKYAFLQVGMVYAIYINEKRKNYC